MIAVGDYSTMFCQDRSSNSRNYVSSVNQVAQQIPSEYQAAREVIDSLLQWLDEQGWSDDERFRIHLAVEEAIVNAIKHGNRNDRSKLVHVSYRVSAESFEMQVVDEGEGFVLSQVPDPTEESRLDVPSGRGLLLMRTYMTTVSFNSAGNEVAMRFDRSNSNGSDH